MKWNIIFFSLCEIIIGALLLVDPIGFTSGIIIALGIALLAAGALCVVSYFRASPVEAALRGDLAKGLFLLLAGALGAFRSGWFIAAFPLLTILYGVVILLAGLGKVQWAVDALRLRTGRWFLPAISAAVTLLCGGVILSDPFASTLAMWMFIGISLIVEAALDIVVLIFGSIKERESGKEKAS